jgi:acylphosphatase
MSTVREALKHAAVRGYVRNLEDGRVEAVFAGPSPMVLSLVSWCKTGPSSARVSALEVREEAVDSSLQGFQAIE